ncbi:MAG: hypothetical protein HQL64_17605 [Magnetococcales bacterium]|nr:hypothetical protein [Magnetococcales bacterium]
MQLLARMKTHRVRILLTVTVGSTGLVAAGSTIAEWYPQPSVQVGYTMNKVQTWRYETGHEYPVQYMWEKSPSVGNVWDYQRLGNHTGQPVPFVRRTPIEVQIPQAVMAPVPVAAGRSVPAHVRVQPTIPADETSPGFLTPETVFIYR